MSDLGFSFKFDVPAADDVELAATAPNELGIFNFAGFAAPPPPPPALDLPSHLSAIENFSLSLTAATAAAGKAAPSLSTPWTGTASTAGGSDAADDPPPIVEPVEAEADFQTGLAYACGSGGKAIDFARAVEYYNKAADGGHAHANYVMGQYRCGRGFRFEQNNLKCDAHFVKAANAGHVLALASCYRAGRDPYRINYAKARRFIRLALERNPNDPDALLQYASCIDSGVFNPNRGVNGSVNGGSVAAVASPEDACTEDAVDLRMRAAGLGSEFALLDLGLCPTAAAVASEHAPPALIRAAAAAAAAVVAGDSLCGSNFQRTEESDAKCVEYYTAAIDKYHNPHAMHQLAGLYLTEYEHRTACGAGPLESSPSPLRREPAPNRRMLELYLRAAALGYAPSQASAAGILDSGGYGLPMNEALALHHYRQCVGTNHRAYAAVGSAELNGWGLLAPDPKLGIATLRRLADDAKYDTTDRDTYVLWNYLVAECELNNAIGATDAGSVGARRQRGVNRLTDLDVPRSTTQWTNDFVMSRLAICHTLGFGCPVEPKLALACFVQSKHSQSTSIGWAVANYVIGEVHLWGCGVVHPNIRLARSCFEAAAGERFVPAMERLEWIVWLMDEFEMHERQEGPWEFTELHFADEAADEAADEELDIGSGFTLSGERLSAVRLKRSQRPAADQENDDDDDDDDDGEGEGEGVADAGTANSPIGF